MGPAARLGDGDEGKKSPRNLSQVRVSRRWESSNEKGGSKLYNSDGELQHRELSNRYIRTSPPLGRNSDEDQLKSDLSQHTSYQS